MLLAPIVLIYQRESDLACTIAAWEGLRTTMKIICAHNFYQEPGGEDASFRATVALLRDHGHEVHTFTRQNADAARMNPLQAGLRTIWSRQAARDLSQLIRTSGAELVHFCNTFILISPAAYYACQALDVPVVQDLRNYRLLCPVATFVRDGRLCEDCLGKTPPWPAIQHACWRGSRPATALVAAMLTTHRTLGTWRRQVDVFITLTEASRQKFIQGGLPAEKIAVKPNFLDPAPPLGEHREKFALFAGRLSPEKGVFPLLQAWESLEGVPLKIAGDGPLAGQVQAAAARHPERIEWLGHQPREEVLTLMRQARVLIFPSVSNETFGNAIIEAYASGLPVIASRVGSMAELVVHEKTGLHFRPNDPEDLAAAVRWAFAHPQQWAAMGQAAREAFETHYTAATNYECLMNIYARAVTARFAPKGLVE